MNHCENIGSSRAQMAVVNSLLGALLFTSTVVLAAENPGRSTFPEPRQVEYRAERKPSVGIVGGIVDPQNGQSTVANLGLNFSIQPYIPFSAGFELSGYAYRPGENLPSTTRLRLLGKAAYNFGGTTPVIRHSYVGFGLGPVVDNYQNVMDVELGFAPMLGFDIPIGVEADPHFSLGATADYLFVGGAKSEIFALNGAVKYWF